MKARAEFMPANLASSIMRSASSQFVCAAAASGDQKSTGNNFGCALRCEFFSHSFSQSSSDGTVTSACYEQA
jgi:hypothetical protein